MPATLFASPDDVGNAFEELPSAAKIDRYLRSATFIIARACNVNPYGYVIPASSVDPLRDAVCAQISSWLALGIDPAALGLDKAPVKKSSILGADVERDTSGQVAALQVAAAQLCPEAFDILLQGGILWQPVPLAADINPLPDFGLGVTPSWLATQEGREWAIAHDWPFV